jgi:hypothetical protein
MSKPTLEQLLTAIRAKVQSPSSTAKKRHPVSKAEAALPSSEMGGWVPDHYVLYTSRLECQCCFKVWENFHGIFLTEKSKLLLAERSRRVTYISDPNLLRWTQELSCDSVPECPDCVSYTSPPQQGTLPLVHNELPVSALRTVDRIVELLRAHHKPEVVPIPPHLSDNK